MLATIGAAPAVLPMRLNQTIVWEVGCRGPATYLLTVGALALKKEKARVTLSRSRI